VTLPQGLQPLPSDCSAALTLDIIGFNQIPVSSAN
jgi:hypothetical protein